MNELALFAGVGGGILAGQLLGWRTVCAVEWEPYAASVLCARQNDGLLESFPIWDDICSFNAKPWRGIVEVVSGGFPCQDLSIAGKGDGLDGERSGMWHEMARVIREVQPRYVFVENSPMLISRGLGTVLGDLAAMGFDAKWGVLGAADIGANHQRDRIWIVGKNVAHSDCGLRGRRGAVSESGENSSGRVHIEKTEQNKYDLWRKTFGCSSVRGKEKESRNWWQVEPDVGRVVDGLASRVEQVRAIGNGQVPLCAATAWRILSE